MLLHSFQLYFDQTVSLRFAKIVRVCSSGTRAAAVHRRCATMGRQSALCIGCNYPQKAFGLLGAVNDAYLWADLLQRRFGF